MSILLQLESLVFTESLTLMVPNRLELFLIHLKLELLTQFPAPNDEKIIIFMQKVYFFKM